MSKVFVEYRSNNSGGEWWLKDDDWKKLEKAGWDVKWGDTYFCHSRFSSIPDGKKVVCDTEDACKGHKKYDNWESVGNDRWIGALAVGAKKECTSISAALKEFEAITGENVTDEGCNCCGAPHSFEWGKCVAGECTCRGPHKDMNYGSGDDLAEYLYGDIGTLSKRELIEKLNKEDTEE